MTRFDNLDKPGKRLLLSRGNEILTAWSFSLEKGDISKAFPELEELGISKADIDAANWSYEKYQTCHGIIALAATILIVLIPISFIFLLDPPQSGHPFFTSGSGELRNQIILHITFFIFALFVSVREWMTAASIGKYCGKNPDIFALWKFHERWEVLSEKYNSLVEIQEMKRRIQQEIRDKEKARLDAIVKNRADFLSEVTDQIVAREERLKLREPEKINDPAQFSELVAGIDREVKDIFLSLPTDKLEDVFQLYSDQYGTSNIEYAKKTYPKWKDGSVTMKGEIAERILALAPTFLDQTTRFDLVRKIRNRYQVISVYTVECSPSNWRKKLYPIIEKLISNSEQFIPNELFDRIQWLAEEDALAAAKILAAVEIEEARICIESLEIEVSALSRIARGMTVNSEKTYTINLPQGTITVFLRSAPASLLNSLQKLLLSEI